MRWQQPGGDLQALVDQVEDFCVNEVPSVYGRCEEKGLFPEELMKPMADLGLFGLTIPEEYGGMGMNTVASSYVARELAYWWPALHLIWTANSSLAAFPIMYAGTEEQKRRILPRLASGEILGCYALTEPNAGSDARSMTTKVTPFQQIPYAWLLNGQKTFITNALHASLAVVFARKEEGVSAFLVESREPGLKEKGITVRYIPKWCLKSSDFCEIHFNQVPLPPSALLGQDGQGFEIAMKTLDAGRINIAAQAIGMAMWLFDEAYKYVHVRRQFKRPIWENQKVQTDFSGWKAELDMAWSRVVAVSEARDHGEDFTEMASGVKLAATEVASRVAYELLPYFGGIAYAEEVKWLPRFLDILPTRVYEGANNIQRMVIAKRMDD